MSDITFVMLDDKAIFPERKTSGASGFDLHSVEDVTIYPGVPAKVRTGVGTVFADTVGCRVEPRSSKDFKGLHVGAGTIDSDYRGEISVVFHNLSDVPIKVKEGEAIAQLVFYRLADMYQVQYLNEFPDTTARGAQGFGHTGE